MKLLEKEIKSAKKGQNMTLFDKKTVQMDNFRKANLLKYNQIKWYISPNNEKNKKMMQKYVNNMK